MALSFRHLWVEDDYSYGKTSLSGNQKPNKDTIFEIGSFTKVFTSLLLADMVQQGQIALEDPIDKFLPSSVRVPKHNNKSNQSNWKKCSFNRFLIAEIALLFCVLG